MPMPQPDQNRSQLESALHRLPHGPEFRFVDRLVALEPGKSGVAEYCLRRDAHFLRGHFPADPLMPGVLMVEAVAQLAGVVAQSDPEVVPLTELKLTALRNVKIHGPARPGDTLRLEAQIQGRLGHLIQARGRVLVGEQVVLEAELSLAGSGLQGLATRRKT